MQRNDGDCKENFLASERWKWTICSDEDLSMPTLRPFNTKVECNIAMLRSITIDDDINRNRVASVSSSLDLDCVWRCQSQRRAIPEDRAISKGH